MPADSTRQDPLATDGLRRTPLHALHARLGARMAAFAGYDMPIQYPAGVLAEHRWTRDSAGLFDVSHMGQAILEGLDAARGLETLVAADLVALPEGRTRYTQLLNAAGGVLDDLMVTRCAGRREGAERLLLVVNAARKEADFALIRARLPHLVLTPLEDRALLALQGPLAVDALAAHWPALRDMPFMSFVTEGARFAWRSGYTGEDGFEISTPAQEAEAFAQRLLEDPRVRPVGLGARDSLRLEAGLCLYGHDLDETTSPVEAGLAWSIGRRRRAEGGFPGAERILRELRDGPARRRVGLALEGRQPAREGAEIVTPAGEEVGRVTSGGFAPSLDRPVAMGYVAAAHAGPGARLDLRVRGKALPARVVATPFVPHRFVR
ncbi:MAG TPA: glycine cleavage system aminomethyltransferase GcvT [Beijerinckiaceae bacterium]|jgi:aminomethyltransferase